MKKVSKSRLKARMLEYFREVENSGEELIVTDNNVPVIRVVPIRKPKLVSEIFAKFRGEVKYYDDLTKPTLEEWEDR